MRTDAPTFEIVHTTKRRPPRLSLCDLRRLKEGVLGKRYELSLVFIGEKRSRTLSRAHRKKDAPSNVLGFALSKNNGELFITLEEARREAPRYDHTYREHVVFLFIHGLLHLKGYRHGSRMEKHEKLLLERFL